MIRLLAWLILILSSLYDLLWAILTFVKSIAEPILILITIFIDSPVHHHLIFWVFFIMVCANIGEALFYQYYRRQYKSGQITLMDAANNIMDSMLFIDFAPDYVKRATIKKLLLALRASRYMKP